MRRGSYAAALDEFQNAIDATLNGQGFERRERQYNRVLNDGLVHTADFQFANKPWLKDTFYFNIGVALPETAKLFRAEAGAWVQPGQWVVSDRVKRKQHRQRLKGWSVLPERGELSEFVQCFDGQALKFFNVFPDRLSVLTFLEGWKKVLYPEPCHNPTHARVLIYLRIGRREQASALLHEEIRKKPSAAYLQTLRDLLREAEG